MCGSSQNFGLATPLAVAVVFGKNGTSFSLMRSVLLIFSCSVCSCGYSYRIHVDLCDVSFLLDWHFFWLHVLCVMQ